MWLKSVELESNTVRLVPLRKEHADSLVKAATDGKLWELWFTAIPNAESIADYLSAAFAEQERGTALAFVVIDKDSNNIIGATRFCHADEANQRVEIGYTWYAKSYQRSAVNTECKQLLLSYAFEALGAIAVEFRTHWHNHQSRAAIARLGAKQDGVLRHHQKTAEGVYRDTVVFSIIDTEWPAVKMSLAHRLATHR
ncbi:MAG: RimJ/RimL family protein N-acetyltransferase [Motiliproteus sp.]|jgi:RimJ/RimL family protein N-acetyltransferase